MNWEDAYQFARIFAGAFIGGALSLWAVMRNDFCQCRKWQERLMANYAENGRHLADRVRNMEETARRDRTDLWQAYLDMDNRVDDVVFRFEQEICKPERMEKVLCDEIKATREGPTKR